jgi:hypothetical protein
MFAEIRKKNGFFVSNNTNTVSNANSGLTSSDMDDLIHLLGPLTEDAVMKTLQARFNEKKYFVGFNALLDELDDIFWFLEHLHERR